MKTALSCPRLWSRSKTAVCWLEVVLNSPKSMTRTQAYSLEWEGAKLDGFCFSTATLLDDGRVLLAGGYARPGGAGVNHAWLYQP